jgi:hypothetical protein
LYNTKATQKWNVVIELPFEIALIGRGFEIINGELEILNNTKATQKCNAIIKLPVILKLTQKRSNFEKKYLFNNLHCHVVIQHQKFSAMHQPTPASMCKARQEVLKQLIGITFEIWESSAQSEIEHLIHSNSQGRFEAVVQTKW